MLIYIHGFNSSPASFKARLVQKKMQVLGRADEFIAPALPPGPRAAMRVLEMEIKKYPDTALIGSSLGGFYATWLAERYALRAVLVNPAVQPYMLLRDFIGPQKNLYSGEVYEFTKRHVAELKQLEVKTITPSRYFLLTRTGDELLDYREQINKYRGARQWVIPGGDHGFGDFSEYLDAALQFCGVAV